MAAMEKTMLTMMVIILGMAIVTQVVQGMAPAPPEPIPGEHICPYCDQTFTTAADLVEHVATVHPDEPPIQLIDIGWD